MKKSLTACLTLFASVALAELPLVTDVVARQGANGRVTITYNLVARAGDASVDNAIVTLDLKANGESIGFENFTNLVGDVNRLVSPGTGKKISWRPVKVWPGHTFEKGELHAELTVWSTNAPPRYAVIDLLSKKEGDIRYYPDAKAIPGGVTNDEYKTTKLVMRHIEAAGKGFKAGDTSSVCYRRSTMKYFSQDYWIGVYELTMAQKYYLCNSPKTADYDSVKDKYNPITGDTHGLLNNDAKAPYHAITYHMMRGLTRNGANWPEDGYLGLNTGNIVTFRNLTGLAFDLPTYAQWEFAARAGSTTKFHDGQDSNSADISAIAWYVANSSASVTFTNGVTVASTNIPHEVGLKTPNAWGLYDVHGNVCESVLDTYLEAKYDLAQTLYDGAPECDPVGPASNEIFRVSGSLYRLFCGGDCNATAGNCAAAMAKTSPAGSDYEYAGVRLWLPIDMHTFPSDLRTKLTKEAETETKATRTSAGNYLFEYTLSDAANPIVTIDIKTNGVSVGGLNYANLAGQIHQAVDVGRHFCVWCPPADLKAAGLESPQADFSFWPTNAGPSYMILNLETKKLADICYYDDVNAIPGTITNDLYKTWRLPFRRIPAKGVTWKMGLTATKGSGCYHYVTFTNDYYLAVFETTYQQVNRIAGTSYGSTAAVAAVPTYPVTNLQYNSFRGSSSNGIKWPDTGYKTILDSRLISYSRLSSYSGELSAFKFDLPTEAQWEYAARAGSTTGYPCGLAASDAALDDYVWHSGNSEGVLHPVGLKKPNAWGLYDMCGNLSEFVLDFYTSSATYLDGSPVTEPAGPFYDETACKDHYRMIRGGHFNTALSGCSAASRANIAGGTNQALAGFRYWLPLDPYHWPDDPVAP